MGGQPRYLPTRVLRDARYQHTAWCSVVSAYARAMRCPCYTLPDTDIACGAPQFRDPHHRHQVGRARRVGRNLPGTYLPTYLPMLRNQFQGPAVLGRRWIVASCHRLEEFLVLTLHGAVLGERGGEGVAMACGESASDLMSRYPSYLHRGTLGSRSLHRGTLGRRSSTFTERNARRRHRERHAREEREGESKGRVRMFNTDYTQRARGPQEHGRASDSDGEGKGAGGRGP
eukprot:1194434-Rhodomonas_salina.1